MVLTEPIWDPCREPLTPRGGQLLRVQICSGIRLPEAGALNTKTRRTPISTAPSLRTTGRSSPNCSTPAFSTNKARMPPYGTLRYNTLGAIALRCSLTSYSNVLAAIGLHLHRGAS